MLLQQNTSSNIDIHLSSKSLTNALHAGLESNINGTAPLAFVGLLAYLASIWEDCLGLSHSRPGIGPNPAIERLSLIKVPGPSLLQDGQWLSPCSQHLGIRWFEEQEDGSWCIYIISSYEPILRLILHRSRDIKFNWNPYLHVWTGPKQQENPVTQSSDSLALLNLQEVYARKRLCELRQAGSPLDIINLHINLHQQARQMRCPTMI